MRILPVLLLLPALVFLGACTQTVPSAIANDDRPASPQPAIASPVESPLTIESLSGTYQPVISEQWVANYLEDVKKLGVDEATLKSSEDFVRRTYDKCKITIYADGRFEFQEGDSKAYGKGVTKI